MQLLSLPLRITTSKPPPIRMQQLSSAYDRPSYGGRYGREVCPHSILIGPVHMEENERHDICDASQHECLALTAVEGSLRILLLRSVRLGCLWMFGKVRNHRDLVPEVRLERVLERGHDLA